MRTDAPTHRRTDAPMRLAVATALLAAELASAASPGAAQRVPSRFGPAVAWREPVARAAGFLPDRPRPGPSPALGRADSSLTVGLFVSETLLGSLGSAMGFYAGAAAGGRSCDVVASCGGEDPGLGRAIIGALAGSWLGTAVGSHVGGGLAGGPVGAWGSRLGAAAGGLLTAIGFALLVHPDADRPATLVPLPLIAAAATALTVPRH